METILTVLFTLAFVLAAYAHYQWWAWRNVALRQEAFINNPNVKAKDKEAEYKDSYEATINALSDERRAQHEAMTEVFDYLNDSQPFGSHNEGLMQCRNLLLKVIQSSTYGRGE